ncbi:MAG: hypothetical protein FJ147_00245 [Deltaproteobacteria bacterium]|nr:hypothetical protein [Deltaproteobacteria bacterium]
MIDTHTVSFGAFRLDVANAHLWRDTEKLSLKPKTFSVLCYLVGRAGQLVTKEELFAALWPDVRVSAAVLKVCIREIREALADQAKAPQFIETVHRRGYQFIAPLATSTPPTLGLEARGLGLVLPPPPANLQVSRLQSRWPQRRTDTTSLLVRCCQNWETPDSVRYWRSRDR